MVDANERASFRTSRHPGALRLRAMVRLGVLSLPVAVIASGGVDNFAGFMATFQLVGIAVFFGSLFCAFAFFGHLARCGDTVQYLTATGRRDLLVLAALCSLLVAAGCAYIVWAWAEVSGSPSSFADLVASVGTPAPPFFGCLIALISAVRFFRALAYRPASPRGDLREQFERADLLRMQERYGLQAVPADSTSASGGRDDRGARIRADVTLLEGAGVDPGVLGRALGRLFEDAEASAALQDRRLPLQLTSVLSDLPPEDVGAIDGSVQAIAGEGGVVLIVNRRLREYCMLPRARVEAVARHGWFGDELSPERVHPLALARVLGLTDVQSPEGTTRRVGAGASRRASSLRAQLPVVMGNDDEPLDQLQRELAEDEELAVLLVRSGPLAGLVAALEADETDLRDVLLECPNAPALGDAGAADLRLVREGADWQVHSALPIAAGGRLLESGRALEGASAFSVGDADYELHALKGSASAASWLA